jgi:hypothetical protein
MRSAAGSAFADVMADVAMLLAGVELALLLCAAGLSLEHPENPTIAMAARLAAASVLA